MWIDRHGAAKSFSTDPEFCKDWFKKFSKSHNKSLGPRLLRSSHKNGNVEQNNGVFKFALDKLSREICSDTEVSLLSRASLLSNMLNGSSVLSAFQMLLGYSLSIEGLPPTIVPKEIFDAHIQLTTDRALLKATKAYASQLLTQKRLPPGTPVWVFYKTSKQNERTSWISATVFEAKDHIVSCRRSEQGPPSRMRTEKLASSRVASMRVNYWRPRFKTSF